MQQTWSETGRTTVLLADLLQTPSTVRIKQPCVYIVRDHEGYPVYVGKTIGSLKARLTGHFVDHSPLARAIERYIFSRQWTIEAVFIDGDIIAAERAFITIEHPILNTK